MGRPLARAAQAIADRGQRSTDLPRRCGDRSTGDGQPDGELSVFEVERRRGHGRADRDGKWRRRRVNGNPGRHLRRRRQRRRGVAMVIVMWVVLVSGLMLVGVMKAARTQRALAHGELSAVEAHWLARAGVEQAMAVLEDDDDLAADSTLEKWYSNPAVFENVELGAGSFSVRSAADENRPGLDDESSKINLNVA